jgi:hypothetical protein
MQIDSTQILLSLTPLSERGFAPTRLRAGVVAYNLRNSQARCEIQIVE